MAPERRKRASDQPTHAAAAALPEPSEETREGRINNIKAAKGYGFIYGDDEIEYFFHRSALVEAEFDEQLEGKRARFAVVDRGKGPRAEKVRVIPEV